MQQRQYFLILTLVGFFKVSSALPNKLTAEEPALLLEAQAVRPQQKQELQTQDKRKAVESRMLRFREETLAATEEKLKQLKMDIERAYLENVKIKHDIEKLKDSYLEREWNLQKQWEAIEQEKQQLEQRKKELLDFEERLRRKEHELAEKEKLLSQRKKATSTHSRDTLAKEHTPEGKKTSKGEQEVLDLDGDGIVDTWLRYDSQGRLVFEEFIIKNDRVKAQYATQGAECPTFVSGDSNGNGQDDFWIYYENCLESRREFDTDHDSQVDHWVYYESLAPETVCIKRIEKDLTGNGKVNYWATYTNCLPERQEYDMNENGIREVVRSVKPGNFWIRRLGFDAKLKAEDHLSKQQYEEAEIWFNKAIDEFKLEFGSLDPKVNTEIADCYLNLGSIYYGKDNAIARSYYDSVAIYGDTEQRNLALVNIANSFFNEKQYQEAAKNYAKAVREQISDQRSLRLYVESILRLAEQEPKEEKRKEILLKAQQLFEELASSWEQQSKAVRANAAWLQGVLLTEAQAFAQAEAQLKLAATLNPEAVEILVSYSWVQFCQGKLEMAIATIQRGLSLKQEDLTILWNLSLYLYLKGDKVSAEKYLNQAIAINPYLVQRVSQKEIVKAIALLPAHRSSLESYKMLVASKIEQKQP